MTDSDRLKELVCEEARRRFPGIEIINVDVDFDEDSEGDEFITAKVIFDTEDGRLPSDALVSFTRYLREAFDRIKEERFPVVSYIWRREYEQVKAAS